MVELVYDQDDFKSATKVNMDQLYYILTSQGYELNVLSSEGDIDSGAVDREFTVTIEISNSYVEADITEIIETYEYEETVSICYIKDIKSKGTNGGSISAGSWVTRDLNDISGFNPDIQLASNQITLQPGAYEIRVTAPACGVSNHQIRLSNLTLDEHIYSLGAFAAEDAMSVCEIDSLVSVSEESVFEVQHRVAKSNSLSTALGYSMGFGDQEQYTTVTIRSGV